MAATLEQPESAGPAGAELASRAAAETYVGNACFAFRAPQLIGAELEWLTGYGGGNGAVAERPSLELVAAALGPYAPRCIAPDSPARALPGGSKVTLEPGGQLELSSAPYADPERLCARLRSDARALRNMLEKRNIRLVSAAADTERRPRRVLRLPRYQAMEHYLAEIGPFGELMMCNTAATQVSVDAGADPAELGTRWRALYAIGPALVAAFARSPVLCGAPAGSWASQRMRTWLRLDNARTSPPVDQWPDPVAGYARWAVDAPLLCVRSPEPVRAKTGRACAWSPPRGATFADWLAGTLDDEIGRRPHYGDLDYHLTTMFPPVRAAGHLEVRCLDTQPGDSWSVPVHVLDALMSTPAAVAEATAVAEPVAGCWLDAARNGLADPQLRLVTAELLDTAAAYAQPGAAMSIHAAAQRCRRGRPPEDSGEYS